MKVSNPRIRVLALKKAEQGDEMIVRLVELEGKPQPDVRISFDTPIATAREVNGQEQPVGPATVNGGALVTSFSAYQPRTFAVQLGRGRRSGFWRCIPRPWRCTMTWPPRAVMARQSQGGFDGKGNALPAEMLPAQITFNEVQFRLAAAKTGVPNAVVAKGQTIDLPVGHYNRVYVLAASADGDQKATFEAGQRRAST